MISLNILSEKIQRGDSKTAPLHPFLPPPPFLSVRYFKYVRVSRVSLLFCLSRNRRQHPFCMPKHAGCWGDWNFIGFLSFLFSIYIPAVSASLCPPPSPFRRFFSYLSLKAREAFTLARETALRGPTWQRVVNAVSTVFSS